MFKVRSSPCPAPNLQSSPLLHPACTAVARRPPTSRPVPCPASHALLSALGIEREGVQPAAELRHLQRHAHECHFPRALLPLPCTLLAPRSPAASRLPARALPSTVCPPFDSRQAAAAFNQPLGFDTSSVTNMGHMFTVCSSPRPAPNLQTSSPLHPACTAVARRLPPPGPLLVPHRMPPF